MFGLKPSQLDYILCDYTIILTYLKILFLCIDLYFNEAWNDNFTFEHFTWRKLTGKTRHFHYYVG